MIDVSVCWTNGKTEIFEAYDVGLGKGGIWFQELEDQKKKFIPMDQITAYCISSAVEHINTKIDSGVVVGIDVLIVLHAPVSLKGIWLGVLQRGDEVEILERVGRYVKIRFEGIEGYVRERFIQKQIKIDLNLIRGQ